MKATIKIEKEVEIKTLEVQAGVRYWEDSSVHGVEDTESGELIPCKKGNLWCPIIEVDTGKILNWEIGKEADVHYKVCDAGVYILKDEEGNEVLKTDGYVPGCMSPAENGYGDYIIMKIDSNGIIEDWEFEIEDFIEKE